MYSYIKNKKQKEKEERKLTYILMVTFAIAVMVVITNEAYLRPFQKGGPFYEPENKAIQAPQTKTEIQTPNQPVKIATAKPQQATKSVKGVSSWYNYKLNGTEWSKSHDTCASRIFKRYSTVKVTNIDNRKSVECYVNDFGPEAWTGREIDLSSHAFAQLADLSQGLINVKIEQL